METFARVNAALNKGVEYVLSALGMAMTLIVTAEVFCRYLLNHSLFWSEELARYILVWLTFLGAAAAYWRKAHPGIGMVTARLNPFLRQGAAILVHLTSLTFFLVMIYHGAAFSYFVRSQITPALSLPKWTVFMIIPVSGLLLACHCLFFLAEEIRRNGRDC